MTIYKIIFAKNEIISCSKAEDNAVLEGMYQYEHVQGKLIYALVRAESEDDARAIANAITEKVEKEVFGSDFVY
ncbi:MAG: hypothetical protein K0Q79_3206 [Flavipsychrobacter sp.]|jgi:hypothetical protein|nr:hypothetical protein [Flavipsychrobacter sp.]